MSTNDEVAAFMYDLVHSVPFLYQEVAVRKIIEKFGDKFTYTNDNGNLAIDKNVLKAFKKLSADTVIWERGDKAWRLRRDSDSTGRSQD